MLTNSKILEHLSSNFNLLAILGLDIQEYLGPVHQPLYKNTFGYKRKSNKKKD